MATFLSSLGLALALAQAPGADSTRRLPAVTDSASARAWLAVGMAGLDMAREFHRHRTAGDASATGAALDTAEQAFARAASLGVGTALGDSARSLRIFARIERTRTLAELGDTAAAGALWADTTLHLELDPALEEVGENLLRACPERSIVLTPDGPLDYAVAFLRLARRLRPDVIAVPVGRLDADSVQAAAVTRAAGVPRRTSTRTFGARLAALAARRPLCASVALDAPPGGHTRLRWQLRPLVWVTGKGVSGPGVAAHDFVFAAFALALQANDPWAGAARDAYRRAAALTPALCEVLRGYGVSRDQVGCR